MRLRAELRQRELDKEFEHRLERLAAEGVVGLGALEGQGAGHQHSQAGLAGTMVRPCLHLTGLEAALHCCV